MTYRPVPMTITAARSAVSRMHRTHPAPVGGLFAIGAALVDADEVVGVAVVSRPVSRMLDDGTTAEVTRLAVAEGHPNLCSWLLGRVRRVAGQLGYKRVRTYTLAHEPGASLRGAGWHFLGTTSGGSWSRRERPRDDHGTEAEKLIWQVRP